MKLLSAMDTDATQLVETPLSALSGPGAAHASGATHPFRPCERPLTQLSRLVNCSLNRSGAVEDAL